LEIAELLDHRSASTLDLDYKLWQGAGDEERLGSVPSTPAQLGAVIRRVRHEREMSVESLAADAGIHWTYLSGIERGQRNPSWKVVGSIASSLGVEISDLARLAEAASGREEQGQAQP
jgi:DNA-binding XRE family transcriptional regulator